MKLLPFNSGTTGPASRKEKFFKGEKHKARGSGIGLAVCDEIITRSGGTLTIANAPGGGTLVSVRLPFAPESSN